MKNIYIFNPFFGGEGGGVFEMTWGVWGLSFFFLQRLQIQILLLWGGGGREREARVSEFFNKESK